MDRYSYTSTPSSVYNRLREIGQLFRMARKPIEGSVSWTMGLYEGTKSRVKSSTGVVLTGMKGLEIGPGQKLGCLRCFGLTNEMVGIDTDIIAHGSNPLAYLRMLRHNSMLRTAKTLTRQALGVDRRFSVALAAELGVESFPPPRLMRMSATAMTFPDASFDFVYSHSVFEHIDDPRAALQEVRRVLRPNGVAYISVHLYTSHSGSHDPKILADGRPVEPLWPHLRPELAGSVHANTYLNKYSLSEWRTLFEKEFPGATHVSDRQDEEIGDGLKRLRATGELSQYTDEELVTVNLIAIWQKPARSDRTMPAA